MIAKSFGYAVAATGLMAGAAWAQTAWVEIPDNVQVPGLNATVDQVDDWDVHSADGTKIGEVEEVVGTDAQTPSALVVDFEGNGGFQDRDVVIPLGQFSWSDNRLTLNADASAVSGMPAYDD